MDKWYKKRGADDDIVTASRITLSRNLYDYPFSTKITDSESLHLIEAVSEAFFGTGESTARFYNFYRLDTLRKQQRAYWVEHCVADASVLDLKRPQALIVSENEAASIWINGDNHLQIRVILRGRQIGRAYDMAQFLDEWLSKYLTYAYSKKYGHLTTAPSDIGTGLHVAYLMRLPMTQRTGLISSVSERLLQSGFSMTAVKSMDCGKAGSVYEVFNKKTLGLTEADILDTADTFADQLIMQERELRSVYMGAEREDFMDSAYKAYGILKYAKKLDTAEARECLALIEQGVRDKNLSLSENMDILSLMFEVLPESMFSILGESYEKKSEDRYRAAFVQSRLPGLI